jgi:hypothetical protein
MCCTGAASSASQIRARQDSRSSRPSLATRTLISSWLFRLTSISRNTASVSPLSPIITTGCRRCARDLSVLRWDGESMIRG